MDRATLGHGRILSTTAEEDFLQVNPEQLVYLREVPLYVRSGKTFLLYKNPTLTAKSRENVEEELMLRLYIRKEDRERCIVEIQKGMVEETLREMIASGDQSAVRIAFSSLLEDALQTPNLRIIHGFKGMVEVLVEEYTQNQTMLHGFLVVAESGYNLAEHSVNIMALLLGYALYYRMPSDQAALLALTGLLHDIGKSGLPAYLHLPWAGMSEADFTRYKTHPQLGLDLLEPGSFDPLLLRGVGDHHERVNGSGYPRGCKDICPTAQLLGMADSYEYLTSQLRPSDGRLSPMEMLQVLNQDVRKGLFLQELFEKFAYSLT